MRQFVEKLLLLLQFVQATFWLAQIDGWLVVSISNWWPTWRSSKSLGQLNRDCPVDDGLSDELDGAAAPVLLPVAFDLVLLKYDHLVGLTVALQDGGGNIEGLLRPLNGPVATNVEAVDEQDTLVPAVQVGKCVPA